MLDCSIAAALGLPDEGSDIADRLVGFLGVDTELWVPPLWWYEITNVLVTAQRQTRISEAESARIMTLYHSLPLRVDTVGVERLAPTIRLVADRNNLSGYDAAYLELAQRRNLGLATLDVELIRAAHRTGVEVFGG